MKEFLCDSIIYVFVFVPLVARVAMWSWYYTFQKMKPMPPEQRKIAGNAEWSLISDWQFGGRIVILGGATVGLAFALFFAMKTVFSLENYSIDRRVEFIVSALGLVLAASWSMAQEEGRARDKKIQGSG